MKTSFLYSSFLLILCSSMLTACTKYADPELSAMDLAGNICSAIHVRCNPNSGTTEAYSAESACNDKLKAEIQTYMEVNKIKFKQADFDYCLSNAGSSQNCEDLLSGKITVPEGCESLSGWFTK